jgi:hypothetical protein
MVQILFDATSVVIAVENTVSVRSRKLALLGARPQVEKRTMFRHHAG